MTDEKDALPSDAEKSGLKPNVDRKIEPTNPPPNEETEEEPSEQPS